LDKEKQFLKFLKKMEDCEGCTMRNYGEPVFSGNVMQEIMIIGFEPESHNFTIDSRLVAKAASLLSLYETEVKYGAYITYLYRCSLIIHGELTSEAKRRCRRYLVEEVGIIMPKYVIIYDKRVISELFENSDEIINASDYPVEAKLFDRTVKVYFIQ
jgi:uracil-DNA glycosylase